jgi:hypothetical protein
VANHKFFRECETAALEEKMRVGAADAAAVRKAVNDKAATAADAKEKRTLNSLLP